MASVLGIDLGTQSIKVVCYDFQTKKFLSNVSSPLDVQRDKGGAAEQLASDWLDGLKYCIDQIPESVKQTICAIGVSGQQHGFVPVDICGEVLAPVKLWCDTSTQLEVDQITEACGGREAAIEMTGNPVVAGFTSPKIRWLKNNHPDLYEKMTAIMLPHDYLNFVLTGEKVMEHGDASGTGLLDVKTRSWSADMLSAIDSDRRLLDCLPELVPCDTFIGKTSKEFSASYGLPAGIPVSVGGGDNMMGAIGTGNVSAGKLTMSLGSSGTLYAYCDKPIVDKKGNIAAFCSSTGGWLPLLCTMNCTIGTELIRDLLGISIEEFDQSIASIPATSDGLLTLPYFNGERTPNLPNGKGCVIGLTPDNCSPGHFLRSTIEGATYALNYGISELQSLGLETKEIVLTGGGANSAQWRQMVADICQLPVSILAQEEGASFGAALQALWVLQREEHPKMDLIEVTDQHLTKNDDLSVLPDPSNKLAYEQGFSDYQNAVEHISPLFK